MRANIFGIKRPRILSVAEAAAELNASEAYVRRLLMRQRLYGTKVGFVWAIYPDDLEMFKRLRRPPGRPPKTVSAGDKTALAKITKERSRAKTGQLLRQRRRMPAEAQPPVVASQTRLKRRAQGREQSSA